jgi:hypothetical protein
MNTMQKTNNERLRELVSGANLTQVESLALFNAGLQPRGYSIDHWKSFFSDPASKRYKAFRDDLLERAEKIFGKLQKSA